MSENGFIAAITCTNHFSLHRLNKTDNTDETVRRSTRSRKVTARDTNLVYFSNNEENEDMWASDEIPSDEEKWESESESESDSCEEADEEQHAPQVATINPNGAPMGKTESDESKRPEEDYEEMWSLFNKDDHKVAQVGSAERFKFLEKMKREIGHMIGNKWCRSEEKNQGKVNVPMFFLFVSYFPFSIH